jgi:hypothetical protein
LKDEEVELAEVRFRCTPDTPDKLDEPEWLRWSHKGLAGDLIAYRVLKWREKKPKVPLGPEDVPPGSMVRPAYWTGEPWIAVSKVCINDLLIDGKSYTWDMLRTWQINRSIPMTGKWNPDAWEACEK